MTDRNDHVSAHPVTRQTGYTELHDAFVDDVNNKGLSDKKAVHYEQDANEKGPVIESTITTHADGNSKSKT